MKKEASKQIHEKAAPFVTWLREAEEETSEEEDGDEVDVVYSNQSSGPTLVTEPQPVMIRHVTLPYCFWHSHYQQTIK